MDRLLPSHFRECIQIQTTGAEESQEVEVLVATGLVDTEEHQVLPQPPLAEGGADDLASGREPLASLVILPPSSSKTHSAPRQALSLFSAPEGNAVTGRLLRNPSFPAPSLPELPSR